MNVIALRSLRYGLGILLLALAASGCRTYGSYGNEAATLAQIQQTTSLFAEDLERARGNLSALERAAAANPALAEAAAQYAAVVEHQAATVEAHQAIAEEAAHRGGNYRWLHRTYGALVTDQRMIEDRYAEVLADLAQTVGAAPPHRAVPLESRYQVAPAFYERIAYDVAQRSLTDLLARAPTDTTQARP